MYKFFQSIGHEINVYQPSRFIEGYGVHPSSIDKAIEDGVELLITVDCGISNLETADYANEKGLTLIITDHHKDAAKHIPKAFAVINPNRRDETVPAELQQLAGVGVAFCLCLAIKNKLEKTEMTVPSLYPLLELVGIGTICDLAKLGNLNRTLTKHGLKQLLKTKSPGLKLFLKPEDQGKSLLESERCSFLIGPCINSKGRLDHPDLALRLLIENDPTKANTYYQQIVQTNFERKKIQKHVFEKAFEQVKNGLSAQDHLISIVYDSEWHEGVIGIVASKLVETFRVPAIVFTDSEQKGIIKASARTAGELDLFGLLDNVKHLFLKFGGHKAAAGLSMKKENLNELKILINQKLQTVPAVIRTNQDSFDLEIDFLDLSFELVNSLQSMEPFGQGNPYPCFRIKNIRLESYKILKDAHVKWSFIAKKQNSRVLQKIGGISFGYLNKWGASQPEELLAAQNLKVDGVLQVNRFNGRSYLQILAERFVIEL
jgi:single-stranded-DNA-specific exonuclease